jgi:uncharacterized protein (DUF4213/DUF364 family)
MSVVDRLQEAIIPGRILAVQVGLYRTAVLAETEDGIRCGLAATLSNPEFDHRDRPPVSRAGYLHEMDYAELAGLIESPSFTEVAIGLATINALLPPQPHAWVDLDARDFLIQHGAGRNIAVIGHFPFVDGLKSNVGRLWVLELNPREGDLPAIAAAEILPQADIVAITATTLINKTFDGLMPHCRRDATVILLGPSTPLSPVLYEFGVNLLAGTVVVDPHSTLMGIGQGVSLHQLRQAGWIRFVTM